MIMEKAMNQKNNPTGSNLGLGLIEVMVSLLLLGIGGYILITSTGKWDKQDRKNREKSDINAIHLGLLKTVKGVLFDVQNQNGKRTEGACKIIKPKSNPPTPPLDTIVINLRDIKTVLTYERFEKVLPDWQRNTSSSLCTKPDEFCFTPKPDTPIKNLRKKDVSLKVKIAPLNMNPMVGDIFRPLSPQQRTRPRDVKSLGFLFAVDLKTKDKKLHKKTFEWLGLLGHCDYQQNGVTYKIATSGMGVVKNPNTIYNRSSFRSSSEDPLEMRPEKIVAQKGSYDARGRYIYTDVSANIATACKEVEYRCPNENSNQRLYSDMSVVASFRYRPDNNVKSGSSITGSLSYSVKKNGLPSNSPIDTYFGFNGVDCSTRACTQNIPNTPCKTEEQRKKFANRCIKTPFQGIRFGTSTNEVSLGIVDKGVLHANNICRAICRKSDNYNTAGTTGNRWQGSFNVAFNNSGGKSQELFVGEIGCTACYMKNCTQMGLGTFGPMDQMSYEPLDAGLPECSIKNSGLLSNLSPYKEQSWPSPDRSDCIFGKLDQTKNRLIFYKADCNNRKSVLCFAFGKYRLARDISSSGTSTLSQARYADAADRCFQMGREITDQTRLDSYLESPMQAPVQGSNYNFNNIANQGIFLAPQSEEDIATFKKWMINEQGINPNTEFWVALKTDGKRDILPRLPLFPSSIDQQRHALYFNQDSNLIHKDFNPFKIPVGATSGEAYPVLFHNIKYKGVRLFREGIEASYLCRKKYFPWKIFLSQNKGNSVTQGPSKCSRDNGLFLPPLTPYEWAYAMTQIEPIDKKYSFPNPNYSMPNSSANDAWKQFKRAWVAASAKGESQTGVEWSPYLPNLELFRNTPSGNYGVFKTQTTPGNTTRWEFDSSLAGASLQKNIVCKQATTLTIKRPVDCQGNKINIQKLCLQQNGEIKPTQFQQRNNCGPRSREIVHSDIKNSDRLKIIWELNKSALPPNTYIAIKK